MAEYTEDELDGATVQGSDGNKIGKVTAVYFDQATDKPEWVSVATGMFGSKEALVPLAAISRDGDTLVAPFDKDMVKNAPHTDPDTELSEQQEAELFTYYGVPYGGETVTATGGVQSTPTEPEPAPQAPAAPASSDGSMTRSEEQLHVGTETVETGRVRLRKRIVTENVTRTVPVSHEEVVIEREPITDGAAGGGELQEEDAELTLHAEQPVVSKETVAVERVGLGSETVAEEQTVSETVRKEQIDTETDGVPGR